MQRALMTTIHMFKNHPNRANIKFVVLPNVRENLHTCGDIGMDVYLLIEKFGEGKAASCGLNIDFSNLFAYGVP